LITTNHRFIFKKYPVKTYSANIWMVLGQGRNLNKLAFGFGRGIVALIVVEVGEAVNAPVSSGLQPSGFPGKFSHYLIPLMQDIRESIRSEIVLVT
jgi:hypothetical protein